MAVEGVEAEGRTVTEATAQALEQLGLRRDQVEVEVLSAGRPRLLGFRGEPARVRVTPVPPPAVVAGSRATQPLQDEGEYVEEAEEQGNEELEEEEYEDEDEEEEQPEVLPAPVRRVPVEGCSQRGRVSRKDRRGQSGQPAATR